MKDNTIPQSEAASVQVSIIAALKHPEVVQLLIADLEKALKQLGVTASCIETITVPEIFNIPYVANMIAETRGIDCVIGLGIIATDKKRWDRDQCLLQNVTDSLQSIAIKSEIPIIHAITLIDDTNYYTATIRNAQAKAFAQTALQMAMHKQVLAERLEQAEFLVQCEFENEEDFDGEDDFGIQGMLGDK